MCGLSSLSCTKSKNCVEKGAHTLYTNTSIPEQPTTATITPNAHSKTKASPYEPQSINANCYACHTVPATAHKPFCLFLQQLNSLALWRLLSQPARMGNATANEIWHPKFQRKRRRYTHAKATGTKSRISLCNYISRALMAWIYCVKMEDALHHKTNGCAYNLRSIHWHWQCVAGWECNMRIRQRSNQPTNRTQRTSPSENGFNVMYCCWTVVGVFVAPKPYSCFIVLFRVQLETLVDGGYWVCESVCVCELILFSGAAGKHAHTDTHRTPRQDSSFYYYSLGTIDFSLALCVLRV